MQLCFLIVKEGYACPAAATSAAGPTRFVPDTLVCWHALLLQPLLLGCSLLLRLSECVCDAHVRWRAMLLQPLLLGLTLGVCLVCARCTCVRHSCSTKLLQQAPCDSGIAWGLAVLCEEGHPPWKRPYMRLQPPSFMCMPHAC